jgi:hypothetical protein
LHRELWFVDDISRELDRPDNVSSYLLANMCNMHIDGIEYR